MVPLQVVIGATSYDEGADGATPELVAEALREFRPVSTSRPAPAAMLEVYERPAADGATAIVSVHLSGDMSGTFESAQLAARDASIPVVPVDSRQVGIATGFAVLAAADVARRRRHGRRRRPSAARARAAASTSLFYVDTLEYLRRGGRIGAAAALLGGALAVKPLLHDRRRPGRDAGEGADVGAGAVAGSRSWRSTAAGDEPVDVGVAHLASADRAGQLAERARASGWPTTSTAARSGAASSGAVLGAHVGPGHARRLRRPARPRLSHFRVHSRSAGRGSPQPPASVVCPSGRRGVPSVVACHVEPHQSAEHEAAARPPARSCWARSCTGSGTSGPWRACPTTHTRVPRGPAGPGGGPVAAGAAAGAPRLAPRPAGLAGAGARDRCAAGSALGAGPLAVVAVLVAVGPGGDRLVGGARRHHDRCAPVAPRRPRALAAPAASAAPSGAASPAADGHGHRRRRRQGTPPGHRRARRRVPGWSTRCGRPAGPGPGVDLAALNLARVLVDGEQIVVGVAARPAVGLPSAAARPSPGAPTGRWSTSTPRPGRARDAARGRPGDRPGDPGLARRATAASPRSTSCSRSTASATRRWPTIAPYVTV